jgi:hypothetical protein
MTAKRRSGRHDIYLVTIDGLESENVKRRTPWFPENVKKDRVKIK